MHNQQTLGIQNQKPPSWENVHSIARDFHSGGLLGNSNAQKPVSDMVEIIDLPPSRVSPATKLEALKKQQFDPESRAERIARSLAALNRKGSIQLTPDEWQRIAEDTDIEDQF